MKISKDTTKTILKVIINITTADAGIQEEKAAGM